MHRFHLSPADCRGDELTLSGREAHHALHVLRLQPGERVVVFDGAGHEYLCETLEATRQALPLRVRERRAPALRPSAITLVQAIPKGKMFDAIVQKATELGAARIVPVVTERVISRLDAHQAEHKADHWRDVAVEAAKQCGNPWLPRIEPPVGFPEFLSRREVFDLSLVASLQPGARHPRDCFRAFQNQHGQMPASVAVWVGPEGDFTAQEIASVQAAGAQPIQLGPLVLRVETAAVYCLSIVNYEVQSPQPDS